MRFQLFDYVNGRGENLILEWTKDLQKTDRAKLNAKLDALEALGDDLLPEVLTGTGTAGIFKLRVKGNVQLRPMLCRGPINVGEEYTLLIGAKEVGGKLTPRDADAIAGQRRDEVRGDPARRKSHERIR